MKYYIFGHPISHSLSPTIHNAAFKYLGLDSKYYLYDLPKFDSGLVKSVITSDSFGGASVTVPHKLDIISVLDEITPSAKVIGAVNTIIVRDGKFVGDNTDWTGILDCVQAVSTTEPKNGLVIGAGGAARAAVYALSKLGLKSIYIYNRTVSKAEELKEEFKAVDIGLTVVHSLDASTWPGYEREVEGEGEGYEGVQVIIGNVPGDAMSSFPSSLFTSRTGVLVEMAYKPDVTPLMKACPNEWTVVRGTDVLLGQGYEQFRLWTGLEPPKKVMRDALEQEVLARAI
ncbi:shikimate-5-dehydrogenase [Lipomyces arxii]|uniref:shikimate-5-dehydrogenase n=1 Tax=Lipomyces arxii TaxID=56418 RepID=UPI0034CF126C